MIREIKITADGSSTLFIPELKEQYHSLNGAVNESLHVFINAGLKQMHKPNITVLEIGFGTGLNAFLTLLNRSGNSKIEYFGVELFPLCWDVVCSLKYPLFLKLKDKEAGLFRKIHQSSWNTGVSITSYFTVYKMQGSILNYTANKPIDLIYFDAFAPQIQPELWEKAVFEKLFDQMDKHGILVTYCAKGEVRRRLQSSGFTVERLPGPVGKREMLRASKGKL